MTKVVTTVCKIASNAVRMDVTSDQKLASDLCMDSLDQVEMVMDLEDEFGHEIPDEVAHQWFSNGDTTVKDVADWIEARQ